MTLLARALLLACLLAAPAVRAGEAESSLDGVDQGAASSLDEADTGRALSPDQAPDVGPGTPDVVGPGAEQTDDGESLDAADTGRSHEPDPAPED